MKKYKLIKEYPGSLKLGSIVNCINEEGYTITKIGDGIYPKKYPEFWEEVVEKDYEILYYIKNNYIFPADLVSLIDADTRIYRVRRLSDSEIFTVGDVVTERMSDKTNVTINRFNIRLDKLIVEVSKNSLNTTVELIFLNKVKQPLFTTEDGVDIYEGYKFYELITPNFHNKPCIWNILEYDSRPNIIYDQEGNRKNGRIWFSTKEKAEEYILYNKPCLSINDVLLSVDGALFLEKTLKEIVKQKLNK